MLYETRFLLSLGLTLLIEVPALFILTRFFVAHKVTPAEVLFTSILASSLTLPYLWFVLPPYVNASYYLQIGEAAVIIVEALIIQRLLKVDILRSLLISAAANMASFAVGLAVL